MMNCECHKFQSKVPPVKGVRWRLQVAMQRKPSTKSHERTSAERRADNTAWRATCHCENLQHNVHDQRRGRVQKFYDSRTPTSRIPSHPRSSDSGPSLVSLELSKPARVTKHQKFQAWQHCFRRVHARARQADQASEPRRYPLGWSRPHAAELRADEEAGRGVEGNTPSGRDSETGHLPGIAR